MNLTRRRVLVAMTAAGSVGALSGTGTVATLSDGEGFESTLTSGIVDLVVEYERVSGPGAEDPDQDSGTIDGQQITLPLGVLSETESEGSMLVSFALPQPREAINNPATLWLATDCPVPAATALAESIHLTVSYADCESGTPLSEILSGNVREVADGLRTGIQIDGDPTTDSLDCLTDQVCLLFEYELVGYVGTDAVDMPMWFTTVQCRNVDPVNPFADRVTQPCPPGEICTCCRTIGKLELEEDLQPGIGESYVEPGIYAFTEGDDRYGLDIYDTTEKDGGTETTGVAFRLVRVDDPDSVVPALCTVAVKGGPGFEQYDRDDDTLTDTIGLPGVGSDGIVSSPDGTAISHITVCICTTEPEDSCTGCADPSLSDTPGAPPGGKK